MPNIGPVEMIVVLTIALLIVGPGKLPQVGSAIGRGLRELRGAVTDAEEGLKPDPPAKLP